MIVQNYLKIFCNTFQVKICTLLSQLYFNIMKLLLLFVYFLLVYFSIFIHFLRLKILVILLVKFLFHFACSFAVKGLSEVSLIFCITFPISSSFRNLSLSPVSSDSIVASLSLSNISNSTGVISVVSFLDSLVFE